MTSADGTSVARLSRPPVCQATLVRSDVGHTFAVFVGAIGVWWPVQPFSAGKDRVRDVTIEPLLGGRVYETWDDGTTVTWGDVLAWSPPTGLVMSWRETPVPTEVELVFVQLGPNLTRVTVAPRVGCAHRGAAVKGLRAAGRLPLGRLPRRLDGDPRPPGGSRRRRRRASCRAWAPTVIAVTSS